MMRAGKRKGSDGQMKASAEQLSLSGDQFIGRSYKDMDCQKFIERCLESIGIKKDLAGSNAWFREMTWTGSPEECMQIFGVIPKGAFIFIHAFDGGEKKRGYHDGKGNASHIGMKTGRGKGAIHSSESRGEVCESDFHDKTIRNGGWNMVGLWIMLDYGKSVNWILEHMGIGPEPENPAADQKKEDEPVQAIVWSENDLPVNFRKSASKKGVLIEKVPVGETVTVLAQEGDWCKVQWKGRTGYMMSEFLEFHGDEPDPTEDPAEDPADDFDPGDLDDGDLIPLYFSRRELQAMKPALEILADRMAEIVGRG